MSHPPPIIPDPDDEQGTTADEFARALEEFERAARPAAMAARAAAPIAVGMKLRGTVVAIGAEHALLDIGARSEAVADLSHFRNEDGTLRIAVGEAFDLFVVEAGDQVVLAPSLRADPGTALRQMREAHAAGVPVTGRVTGLNAGGLEVDLGGARGFCPLSQIETGYCADPSTYAGRTLEFLVTGIEDSRRSFVLSRRQLLRRAEEEETRRRLAALKPGDELEGTVARLEAFGAFVDLGGVDGLVHVSEIQYGRVSHPRDVLREGEKVRVRVLRIEAGPDDRPRIALSIKASAPDPWTNIQQSFAPGMRVKGVVVRLADFGAFVTLAPGIDGLVHVSEIAPHRIERVKDALAVGQEIEAIVLAVDVAKKRISLSIRAALAADEQTDAASGPGGRPTHALEAAPAEMPSPQPAEAPPTTMAIALREAAEKARRKQAGSSS
jgi:small subunit ribosomal protein S1